MNHKAQEALDGISNMLFMTDYVEHIRCHSYRILEEEQAVIKQLLDCQLAKEEINEIMNCLSVACFNNELYNSIFDKLKKQKEMWEE